MICQPQLYEGQGTSMFTISCGGGRVPINMLRITNVSDPVCFANLNCTRVKVQICLRYLVGAGTGIL
jgi:hypothetical protein